MKALTSHQNPEQSWKELILLLAKKELKKWEVKSTGVNKNSGLDKSVGDNLVGNNLTGDNLVDINSDTFNIDAEKIENAITPKTKAIIPVHLYGQPANMKVIMEIAKKHNLFEIEDCCQAIGAKIGNQMVGTFGDVGCFSFFPTKNLGGMGDGGLLVTNSSAIYDKAIALRNHGGAVRYHNDELGVNSRLDEIQAAILRIKLKRRQY